ncbi:hypothetical protein NDU88_006682 [Pleurodeles waltl]|uniref:Uncharacterized protein n=1 Tax=Pleurodeles waltl TaxID=8319 RepID=A0AAV7PJ44_PLEWA|nr:hypothetical protein NDU88_006682 [Pleurodeles waltl]
MGPGASPPGSIGCVRRVPGPGACLCAVAGNCAEGRIGAWPALRPRVFVEAPPEPEPEFEAAPPSLPGPTGEWKGLRGDHWRRGGADGSEALVLPRLRGPS